MRTTMPSLLLALGACAHGASPSQDPAAAPQSEALPKDPTPIASTEKHPFSVLDMLAMDRISGHQVSPDGQTIVFVRQVTDLEYDRGRTDLWSIPVAGGKAKRLTDHPDSDGSPRWSPDGSTLYFLSSRSGSTQIWSIPSDGGPARQLSELPLSVTNLAISPDGRTLAFSAEVFIDCPDLACTKKRLEERKASKRTGLSYDRLFVRHWDTWKDGRRSHLFVMPVDGGPPQDLTAGLDADVPSKPFGDAGEFTFSPDSQNIVYSARVAGAEEPWSTDFDLYMVPVAGGLSRELTADNPAWDTHPVYSPDGKTLVWMAMERAGYEADRFRIRAMDISSGQTRALTEAWDRSAKSLSMSSEGDSILVVAQNLGQRSIYRVDMSSGEPTLLVFEGSNSTPVIAGDEIVFARHTLVRPTELYAIPQTGGEVRRVTRINDAKVNAAQVGEPEQFSFEGANGDTVYGYLVKPVDFDPSQKYPIAFLIHGGPQGSFGNMFHYRWNPQAYAGAGYAVMMIDFHGSTGYGQAFTDSIGGDWGGKPLTDLKKGLAFALERHPWLDGANACALGASYGGFMINWIAGRWPEQFRCLVNHDGVFDQRSMYYTTEELWFPEWEQRGPYFENPRQHEKHNPVAHVDDWKTPMLIIHGALDYRVPLPQGLGAFTAAQRRGIESRLLVFPDENHWVLRPNNSIQWHEAVFDWLETYLGR
ncbi:MAG: S9 family peptidase [Myxococcota bacterium]